MRTGRVNRRIIPADHIDKIFLCEPLIRRTVCDGINGLIKRRGRRLIRSIGFRFTLPLFSGAEWARGEKKGRSSALEE